MTKLLRVWDLPTRLFHWALVVCVVALVVTGKVGGAWMNWHMRLGYAVGALLLFRLGWGVVGGHWSRFATFVPGPARLWAYLKGSASHTPGHNPLGALSVLALLAVLGAQVVSGLLSDDEIAFTGPWVAFASGDTVSWATWYHAEVGKLVLLGWVGLHVLAIVFYGVVKRKRLVPPMLTGDAPVAADMQAPASADGARQRWLALVWWVVCVAVVAWAVTLTPAGA